MIIEKLIKTLKNDPNYKWESVYSGRDLFSVAWVRCFQVIRGLLLKPFLKRSAGLLFVGTHVKVRHGYQITAGKNLILGDNVDINALSTNGIQLGDNVSIARDSILFCTGVIAQKGIGITIGDRTGIGARAFLAGQGGITIGSDVITGPNIQIFSENHNFSDLEQTIKTQGVTKQVTVIGSNCWLGGGVTILAGVTIGDGCIIAAGSVVTKSVPQNSVVAGVPAKVVKSREAI
jgi:acetyltransferase-like isoleucine patch superfamily enzyme